MRERKSVMGKYVSEKGIVRERKGEREREKDGTQRH